MRRVSAEELAAKRGAGAATAKANTPQHKPRVGRAPGDGEPHPYELANQIATVDVCVAYGLGTGKTVTCPVCKAVGDWVNEGGLGFKCFHNTCKQFAADNLGLVATVQGLGETKGDGEEAKLNKRNAYNELRARFTHLPALLLSKEERAGRAREMLAGMNVEDALEAPGDHSDRAHPPKAEPVNSDGESSADSRSDTRSEKAKGNGPRGTNRKSAKVEPDLGKIRERLAVLVDLPVDEREVEFGRLLSVYNTTRAILRATLHELEVEGRKHGRGNDRERKPWEQQLLTRPTPWGPKLERNVHNIITILRNDEAFAGALRFDAFAERIVIVRSCPACLPADAYPLPWSDVHDVRVAAWLQSSAHRLDVGSDQVANAVPAVALEHRIHPLKERLLALKWDGEKRLDKWLFLYLGAPDTPYTSDVGAMWLISAIARVMRPGCKADHVLVLEGVQGARKSTAVKTLSYGYFTDEIADLGSKDAAMQLHGVWIVEFAELDAIGRADVSRQKQFVTKTFDRYRAPYGRHVADHPRQCVFVGTVNKGDYLKDETGGRRWWPVACGKIDLVALERDRDQLWAEAVARFDRGDPWWLASGEATVRAEEEQAERYQGDAWDATIEKHIDGDASATIEDILQQCFDIAKKDWGQPEQNRVARCLKRLGWTRRRVRLGDGSGAREWRYFPPVPTPPVSPVAGPISGDSGSSQNQALVPSVHTVPSRDGYSVGDLRDKGADTGDARGREGGESVGGLNADGGDTGDSGDKSHFLDSSGVPTSGALRPRPGSGMAIEEHVVGPIVSLVPAKAEKITAPPAANSAPSPCAEPTAAPQAVLDPTLPHGDQVVEIFGVRHSTGELRVRLPIGLDEHAPRPEATFMTTYRGDELDAYVDSITDDACMTRATVEQRRFDGRVISVVVGLRHPSSAASAAAASGIQAEPVWGWAAHHSGGGTEWADRELEDVA